MINGIVYGYFTKPGGYECLCQLRSVLRGQLNVANTLGIILYLIAMIPMFCDFPHGNPSNGIEGGAVFGGPYEFYQLGPCLFAFYSSFSTEGLLNLLVGMEFWKRLLITTATYGSRCWATISEGAGLGSHRVHKRHHLH